ncbi:MAG: chlorite dismutase family protein [bacterium]|uniref:Chlorite dismutase family protein n=1 Tax=Candidatus Methylomirabilis tolerans TaxID=3123416 RepID=A0AAJ1EIM2_9BACT|nr:chlorite dismutase family protein [Candidatus Methylomirabilis sp.]
MPTSAKEQFINFAFYKVDSAWRRLPKEERGTSKKEFGAAVEQWRERMLLISYSTVGLRPDTDFMLWRIGDSLMLFQEMSRQLNETALGACLTTPYSYVAMSRRSTYVARHLHPGQEGHRSTIIPGEHQYLFVYPFVKQRDWYLLPLDRRQEMMNVHIKVGHKFPSVKLNTTYSFGLDDQEFVVAFESDRPADFVELIMALRETEASRFTLRDTPIFTCIQKTIHETLDDLG